MVIPTLAPSPWSSSRDSIYSNPYFPETESSLVQSPLSSYILSILHRWRLSIGHSHCGTSSGSGYRTRDCTKWLCSRYHIHPTVPWCSHYRGIRLQWSFVRFGPATDSRHWIYQYKVVKIEWIETDIVLLWNFCIQWTCEVMREYIESMHDNG